MNEKFLILERNIQKDLETINDDLGSPKLDERESQETVIVVAYRLHSLYSAFENIFRNIASAFENQVDQAGWHRQLLERMRLDLTPIRPAVIDSEIYDKLDEMLRFRHVFRTLYGYTLDPLRLQIMLRKALELKPLYQSQIERFLQFLRQLE